MKIVLVGIMILLAVFNRFVLLPQLKPGATALAVLRSTSALEVALGSVVVALVSAFALLDQREAREPDRRREMHLPHVPTAQKGLAFGSKASMCVERSAAQSAARMTL